MLDLSFSPKTPITDGKTRAAQSEKFCGGGSIKREGSY